MKLISQESLTTARQDLSATAIAVVHRVEEAIINALTLPLTETAKCSSERVYGGESNTDG